MYVKIKYHDRVSKWYDIVMGNGYFTGDAELKLKISKMKHELKINCSRIELG